VLAMLYDRGASLNWTTVQAVNMVLSIEQVT
jgi:hypothetical protein